MVAIPGYSSNGSNLPYTSCVLTNRSQAPSTTNSCPSISKPPATTQPGTNAGSCCRPYWAPTASSKRVWPLAAPAARSATAMSAVRAIMLPPLRTRWSC